MTNQEINEAVARKLGKIRKDDDGHDCLDCIPNYSTDIAAAWEIMEYLASKFAFVELKFHSGQWQCWLSKGWDTKIQHEWRLDALAKTAPMAICLAFLKLEDNK